MFKVRRALYIQLGVVALLIGGLLVLSYFFPIADFLFAAQQRVVGLGRWSAVAYVLLFAVCNILLLPGGILSVGAGFFFGLWWGFTLMFVGNCLSAAVSFGLSRLCGRAWLQPLFSRKRNLVAVADAVEREGWKIVLLSQLHPLFPTSLLNYLYGLTKIRFRTFMFWAAIGRAPGLFVYAYLGTLGQYGLNIVRHKTHPRAFEYVTWGGAFVTTAAILWICSRIAFDAINRSQRSEEASDLYAGEKPVRLSNVHT